MLRGDKREAVALLRAHSHGVDRNPCVQDSVSSRLSWVPCQRTSRGFQGPWGRPMGGTNVHLAQIISALSRAPLAPGTPGGPHQAAPRNVGLGSQRHAGSARWALHGVLRRRPSPQSPLTPSLLGATAAPTCSEPLRNLGLSSWDAPCRWHPRADGQTPVFQVRPWAPPRIQGLSLLQALFRKYKSSHSPLLVVVASEAALLLSHLSVAHGRDHQWFCWLELRWEEEA